MTDFEERLRSALGDRVLTDQEARYLFWLAGWDQETVETFAGLFEKCRAERRGHWIWYEVSGGRKRCKCSECGEPHGSIPTKCCPECGVKMEGVE